MARRSRAEGTLILLALIVGLPIYVVSKVLSVTGWVLPLAALIAVIAVVVGVRAMRHRQRVAVFREKYSEVDVQRILAKTIWQGQTEEQLVESLGHPAAVDRKVLKTVRREVCQKALAHARTEIQRD